MKFFFTKIYILLFFFISYPAISEEQYACFKLQDQTPIKVVEDKLNLYITWNKYPIEYNFMYLGNSILVAGRMYPVETSFKSFKKLFDGNLEAFEKIKKELVVFDKTNMKLSYSSIQGNGYKDLVNMKCVSLN